MQCAKQIDIDETPVSPVSSVPSVVKVFDLLANATDHADRNATLNAHYLRRTALAGLKKRSDVLLEHGGVRCTHVFGVNASLSIDQERNGQAKDSPIC